MTQKNQIIVAGVASFVALAAVVAYAVIQTANNKKQNEDNKQLKSSIASLIAQQQQQQQQVNTLEAVMEEGLEEAEVSLFVEEENER